MTKEERAAFDAFLASSHSIQDVAEGVSARDMRAHEDIVQAAERHAERRAEDRYWRGRGVR